MYKLLSFTDSDELEEKPDHLDVFFPLKHIHTTTQNLQKLFSMQLFTKFKKFVETIPIPYYDVAIPLFTNDIKPADRIFLFLHFKQATNTLPMITSL